MFQIEPLINNDFLKKLVDLLRVSFIWTTG